MNEDKPLTPVVAPTQAEAELSRKSSGQRHINLIWEFTQAFIAGTVVSTVLLVSATLVIKETASAENKMAAFVFLTGVANLVIGFYFGRTNHQRVGGVGASNMEHR